MADAIDPSELDKLIANQREIDPEFRAHWDLVISPRTQRQSDAATLWLYATDIERAVRFGQCANLGMLLVAFPATFAGLILHMPGLAHAGAWFGFGFTLAVYTHVRSEKAKLRQITMFFKDEMGEKKKDNG